jgi:hypothetical protein
VPRYGAHDVRHIGAAGDQGRPLVNHPVEQLARVVVGRVVGGDQRPAQSIGEVLGSDRLGCRHGVLLDLVASHLLAPGDAAGRNETPLRLRLNTRAFGRPS